ncbi:MAG: hypothetical protein HYY06_24635 [Deltaproteobacteria bacterium]|nr:hypothetical protein [Deltaproteobacteria bacterium]
MRHPARCRWIAVVALAAMLETTVAAILCCRLLGSGHDADMHARDSRAGHADRHVRHGAGTVDGRRSLAATLSEDRCPPVEAAPARLAGDPHSLRVPRPGAVGGAGAGSLPHPVDSHWGKAATRSRQPPATGPPVLLRTCSLLI